MADTTSIILELQHMASDNKVGITDLLQKALLVASKLGLEDFKHWILKELEGYPDKESVPDYRIVSSLIKAYNPYQGWIHCQFDDQEMSKNLSNIIFTRPIGELEVLALSGEDKNGMLEVTFTHETINILMEMSNSDLTPTRFINKAKIFGILDTVRTKVLKWTLKLAETGKESKERETRDSGDITSPEPEKGKDKEKLYQTNTFKFVVIPLLAILVMAIMGTPAWLSLGNKTDHDLSKNTHISSEAKTTGDNSPIVGGDYVAGNKSKVIKTEGDYISGDKVVSYNTYVNYCKNEGRVGDIVSDATILTFFYKYSSVFNQIIREVPKQSIVDLPDFLKMPYNMNVVISECRGLGFEYTIPSDNPEIILTHTTAPVEKHFFTKYTNRTNFPKSVQFIKVSKEDIMWINSRFVGSGQVFWVIENADLQLINAEIKYSEEDDDPKNIHYLWIFGSNSTEYWSQLDPAQLAKKNAIRLIKTYIMKQTAETSYNLYRSRTSEFKGPR